MLLATRSSDSIRARSPLAAMAVMGSMRVGKSTTRSKWRLVYNCLKELRIPPKRRIGKPANRGKNLPDMARWAILCRATSDQLLENAAAPVWPSSCNFRRVAALALPPSLLAQNVRVSAPGASSRLTADTNTKAESAAAPDGIFPELLAGLVASNGAAAGQVLGPVLGCCAASPAKSLDAAPRLDMPAGIETLLDRKSV